MHIDDLVAIRDALTAIIALPAPIREVVASLIAPARHRTERIRVRLRLRQPERPHARHAGSS